MSLLHNAHNAKSTVIAITGPTATGKTRASVALAQSLIACGQPCCILSADSRLVYRHVDIGTAKPTLEERQGVDHHLIDLVSPLEAYSVARYQADATKILTECHNAGMLPLVVGGTGFYLKALLEAPDLVPPVPPHPELRQWLEAEIQTHGVKHLHDRLKTLDPERAEALYETDAVRIIRALEIIEVTGQKASAFFKPLQSSDSPYHVRWLGLTADPAWLRQRIADRVHLMMQSGWLDEVRALLKRYPPDAPGLSLSHGYPELIRHLQTGWPLEAALAQTILNSQQYARRQRTWFRRNPAIEWTSVESWAEDAVFDDWIQHQTRETLMWLSSRQDKL